MIRAWRSAVLLVLFVVSACGLPGASSFNGKPTDVWSIMPSQADVRSLMGDSNNWYAGPPSFEVDPLDAGTRPAALKFAVSQVYDHLGSAEQLFARYSVFDKTSSATTEMTDIQTLYGQSVATSPKVGDQVLYYVTGTTGGAPYLTRTFVRVGQVVLELVWTKKDTQITIGDLGKHAKLFADPLRNLGKAHAQTGQVAAQFLPPPGLDITQLGSAVLPLESFVVMINTTLPGTILSELQGNGATNFAYGDFALNNDTHMEVQTAVLRFPSAGTAAGFAAEFAPSPADQNGIGSGYLKESGSPAAGEYWYVFSASAYGVLMICKASVDGEAASRECEGPMETTAIAWKGALASVP